MSPKLPKHSTRRQRAPWLVLFVGVLVALLLVLWSAQGLNRASGDDSPVDNPVPSGSATVDMNTFATNVALTDAADAADQQAMANAQNTVLAGTPFTKSVTDLATIAPGPTQGPPTTGIFDHPVPEPGWGQLYEITNAWAGVINGNLTTAFAGSKADDPGDGVYDSGMLNQGMVRIETYTSSDGSGTRLDSLTGDYLTATRSGPVKITTVSGTCLTLQTIPSAPGGPQTTFHFDVSTRQWSCSK